MLAVRHVGQTVVWTPVFERHITGVDFQRHDGAVVLENQWL